MPLRNRENYPWTDICTTWSQLISSPKALLESVTFQLHDRMLSLSVATPIKRYGHFSDIGVDIVPCLNDVEKLSLSRVKRMQPNFTVWANQCTPIFPLQCSASPEVAVNPAITIHFTSPGVTTHSLIYGLRHAMPILTDLIRSDILGHKVPKCCMVVSDCSLYTI